MYLVYILVNKPKLAKLSNKFGYLHQLILAHRTSSGINIPIIGRLYFYHGGQEREYYWRPQGAFRPQV